MRYRRVGLITYDHPHLKTEQVMHAFLRRGYEMKIYALPFTPRNRREVLIHHRPDQSTGTHPRIVARSHGIEFTACDDDRAIDDSCDIYHILAGRILSPGCVVGKRIINCHPGVIPAIRGLDAFKWAIRLRQQLGCTLHLIDAEVDRGEILSTVRTDVYHTDTIEDLARRHYENEIEITSDFERYMERPISHFPGIPPGERHMRMNRKTERQVLDTFDDYVELMTAGSSRKSATVGSAFG